MRAGGGIYFHKPFGHAWTSKVVSGAIDRLNIQVIYLPVCPTEPIRSRLFPFTFLGSRVPGHQCVLA
jgi:hypothetical protein